MEFNRRELLKYFGIGATIVPVVNGAPKIDIPAKLIQPASVEPFMPRIVKCDLGNFPIAIAEPTVLTLERMMDGQLYRLNARSFLIRTELSCSVDSIASWTIQGIVNWTSLSGLAAQAVR